MKVQLQSNNSFQGYDARRLTGFLMSSNYCGIADDMAKIGKKEGFKLFAAAERCYEGLPIYADAKTSAHIWAQDYWTIVKNNILAEKNNPKTESIKKYLNLSQNSKSHIKGGNVFIVEGNSEDEVLIGADELKRLSSNKIKSMYGVDKVTVIPQMDYHLDLFLRPLDKKRVLLADDEKTLVVITRIKKRLTELLSEVSSAEQRLYRKMIDKLSILHSNFEADILANPFSKTDETAKVLEESGFEVIRVPGRLYNTFKSKLLLHKLNYINANVIKNSEGDFVYITNKSNLSDSLCNFEEEFIESISQYVKREHIYFINGDNTNDMLYKFQGGIHCACTEVPVLK